MGYSAGVYTNPAPAQQNTSGASPLPDAIWVAKYDSKATTWHLGVLGDNLWATHQRLHQYAGNTTESYGGISFMIDRNIVDAPVAGSNGVKTYSSWALSLVDYPDSRPTPPFSASTRDIFIRSILAATRYHRYSPGSIA